MPEAESIQRIVREISRSGANYRYFFEKIDDPKWIRPLLQADPPFFSTPIPAKHEGDYISFPVWPESRFLVRIADRAPSDVCDVILQMPATDNVRVHEDLVEAALKMPPALATRVAAKESAWIREQQHVYLLLGARLGKLAEHLATGGEADAAFALAEVLLEVVPDARRVRSFSDPDTGDVYRLSHGPRAKIDDWDYFRVLERSFPSLGSIDPQRALRLVCDLLTRAVELSITKSGESARNDQSAIWRPAIEDHEHNTDPDLRAHLVSAVRDHAEAAARSGREDLLAVIGELEARGWLVFRRIALHVLRRLATLAPDHVESRLVSEDLFDDEQHEYVLLLKDCFELISPAARETILGFVARGPDLEPFRRNYRFWHNDEEPGEQETAAHKRYWQRDRLFPLRGRLPDRWRATLEELVSDVGEPEHPEFPHGYVSSAVRRTESPKSVDELSSMSDQELMEFLRDRSPDARDHYVGASDLSAALESAVGVDVPRFSRLANRFQGLRPEYIRSLFYAYRKALSDHAALSWADVLALGIWTAHQRSGADATETKHIVPGSDWRSAKQALASFLGISLEGTKLPSEFRDQVWAALTPLADDLDPAQDGGKKESDRDPQTVAINSVRGEAIGAVFQYAIWVAAQGNSKKAKGAFSLCPEAKDVLETHLDPRRERSLAIRSVYGRLFAQAIGFDRNWCDSIAHRVFDFESEDPSLAFAAWETYLVFNRPYAESFEVLEDRYRWSIEHLERFPGRDQLGSHPITSLGEHLVLFYVWGILGEDLEESLLGRFFRNIDTKRRGDVIDSAGRMLKNTEGKIEESSLERFRRLWDWLLEDLERSPDLVSRRAESDGFGWWFVSGHFPNGWSLPRLLRSVKIAGAMEPEHLLVGALGSVEPENLAVAIRCADGMVSGHSERWRTELVKSELRSLLERGIGSSDRTSRDAAFSLVNRLGAMGFFEFRDLTAGESGTGG